MARVQVPPRVRTGEQTSTLTELREGWTFFRGTTWLWVVVLAFAFLNAIHAGAWLTLGPAVAKETIGAKGWGYALSAESIGLLLTTAIMMRRRLERPLLVGMVTISGLALPLVLLGATHAVVPVVIGAFVAGAGIEVFNLGWNLAMQEHVEERMLSRAYSYDALGSLIAMPVGQLAYGALGVAFGFKEVLVLSGIAYAVIALATLGSRSVRELKRAELVGV